MKHFALALLLLGMTALLSGCAQMNIEAQAYAVTMGIDQTGDGGVKVSVQTPSLNDSGGGEDSGSGGGKGYTLSSAQGRTLSEALNMLQASIPREMNLSGIKSIVVSAQLAQSGRFRELLEEMAKSYRVYGAAELIVCLGEAEALINDQQPVIGLRLSESVAVELAHCRENGYIPSAKAADVYYLTESIYGDPLAVLAAANEEESGARSGQTGDGYAGGLPRSGDNKNVYFGSALFKDGRMVGMLTGLETQLVNMLLGEISYFSWMADDVPVNLNPAGKPRVEIRREGESLTIGVSLTINVLPPDRNMDAEGLKNDMERRLTELTAYCQEKGVDPFRYAERAAAGFPTVQAWMDYNWDEKFPQAQVNYEVSIRMSEL